MPRLQTIQKCSKTRIKLEKRDNNQQELDQPANQELEVTSGILIRGKTFFTSIFTLPYLPRFFRDQPPDDIRIRSNTQKFFDYQQIVTDRIIDI